MIHPATLKWALRYAAVNVEDDPKQYVCTLVENFVEMRMSVGWPTVRRLLTEMDFYVTVQHFLRIECMRINGYIPATELTAGTLASTTGELGQLRQRLIRHLQDHFKTEAK